MLGSNMYFFEDAKVAQQLPVGGSRTDHILSGIS